MTSHLLELVRMMAPTPSRLEPKDVDSRFLVWMTEHHRNCINGKHEPDPRYSSGPILMCRREDNEGFMRDRAEEVAVCRYCKSIFPESA